MSSIDTSTRRRFSDSQVPRSNLDRLLVPEEAGRVGLSGDSSSSEDRGAFETIGRQLELEEKLHILSQQLLQSYKETQQWACVGQLAQGLIASSQRVGQLKQQLESLRERSGGLFLESIRERSLPREDDHAPGADHQSPEKYDTTQVLVSSSRIPVEQDTPDSFEQAASEFVQPSAVDHEEIADSLSGAADLSPVPAASPTEELKERPKAGVKNTDEQKDAEPSIGGDLEPDSSAGVSEEREENLTAVESLEQPCAAELDKDNINSSVPFSAPETSRGDTPPFEDASSSDVLVDTSASEDQVETAAEEKLEVESAVDEFVEKEAIVVPPSGSEPLSPPATVQEAAAPIELNSSCQQVEEKEEAVSKADRDSVELERDEEEKATSETFSPSKSESPPPPPSLALPQALEEFELASSDLQQGTTDESEVPLDIESEDSKLDQSTPPTTVAHTEEAREETSKHQQSIEQVDTTPLTAESLGETHHIHLPLGDNDGLGPTKSASSIDREFGLVDDCLDELTSEIEALVIASELSSETSEQFFSPPESITVEVEYEDSLLPSEPKSLKEIAKEAAAVLVDQVVPSLEEEKVEEKKRKREKSPNSDVGDSEEAVKETTDTFDTKDSGEEVDTEINFEREREGSSDSKENSPGIIGEREKSPDSVVGDSEEAVKETTDNFDTKDAGEEVDTEIKFEREREGSSDSKENSPGITGEIEEGLSTVSPETDTKEVSLGEEEEDSRERQGSPEITFKPAGEEPEPEEAVSGEKEDNSREKEESPEVVLESGEEEQNETSDTVDFEPQTTDLPPPEQKETSDTVDSDPKVADLPQKETSDTVDSEPKDTEAKETSDTVDSDPKIADLPQKETSDTVDSEPKDTETEAKEISDTVEQIETSDTVDSESKDTPPPIAEIDKPATAEFNEEEIDPIIDSDVATISETATVASTTAGVQDFQETEEYTQKGDKMEPKLAITYSVRKSITSTFSDDNKLGTTVYRIDPVSSENGHTCTQSTVTSKPVERCLEEFIELHQKLLSLEEEQVPNGGGEEGVGMMTRGVPQLNLDERKLDNSTRENGAFSDKEKEREGGEELVADQESEILEAFLNQVVNSSYFQNEPIVTNFLSPNVDDMSTPSPLTNGVKEQEQGAEPSVNDVIVNGRVASEEETSTTEQESKTLQPNGADQLIDGHHSNQSAQSGEDDARKSDQVNQSDQPSATEDSAALANSEDTITTIAASQSIPPEEPQEVRGHEVSFTADEFDEEEELCLLPEKTQDVGDSVGGGGGDLGDGPSDLGREVPTNKEETRLSHGQEDDTTKELSSGGEESSPKTANSPSHAESTESGSGLIDQASPKEESDKLVGGVPKDAAVSSESSVESPIRGEEKGEGEEVSTNVEDEEKEREPSLSPFHSKSLSFGKEMMVKPSISPAVASLSKNGEESDLSPTHSERTSSNATTSSYLYTTDESSASPQKSLRPVSSLQRTSSSPTRESESKLTESMEEARDTFHMSLIPSQARPISPEGLMEAEAMSTGDSHTKSKKKIKRKGSMPEKIRSSIGNVKRTLTTKKRSSTSASLPRNAPVDSEGINNVSVLKPLTTQEWDPTCLLEELYSDYKQGLVIGASSGEAARHCGYLDKLPTNRTKANVMTKWKRRYFRAQEGNIYYYQDRRAERALGFIHLQSSRVIQIPEKMQLQIIPKDGKSIMLKVPDKDELQAWHRALLLEAAHPTLIAPSSPKPALENPIIIIDVGACSVRAGLVREDPYPEIFFPAVCSFDAESFDVIECGLPALLPDNRYKAHQVYPRKTSLRMDRQRSEANLPLKAMDAIVSTIMMQLDIDPQVAQLIMTLPPTAPGQERDDLVELLLDTFGFAGICLQDQTQLALYSYNTTTGIIVDIGNHITVVPYIDGYAIEAGITRLPFGGNAITENLAKLVTMKGMRYFSETEMFINRFIKESLCYVSHSFEEDLAECDKDPKAFIRGVDVDRFQLPDHRKMITLDASLFKAPEGLFSPHLWGKDVPGLHEIVWKAIQACPIDQRREVSKNIFLSGGSSVIPGLKERLQKEVASMAPTGVAIEVHTRGSFHHAAYCGASVLASLGSFQNYVVSWDDWSTAGAEALKKWTGS